MKLVSFVTAEGRSGYGAVRGDGVVDLGSRLATAPTLLSLLATGQIDQARQLAGEAAADIPLAGLKLMPVIPDPGKIVCVGLNYHDHVVETGRTVTENPTLFARYPSSRSATCSRW